MFGSPALNRAGLSPPFMKGGDTVSTLTAGLPEIYGAVSRLPMSMMNGAETFFSGVFKDSVAPSGLWTATGSGQSEVIGAGTLAFQASDYNAIYGKSSTVQPPALQLIPQIRY